MLQLKYKVVRFPFQYPFTTHKGTKTHQEALLVSLGMGVHTGYGEAPAIAYYNVTTDDMVALLEAKKSAIERYSLTEPTRFWHFLHHLIPGAHFLTAALDMAAWDLYARLRKQPLYKALQIKTTTVPVTDYTIGMDTLDNMVEKLNAHPHPVYKVKVGGDADIDTLLELRRHTQSAFRIDANEGWTNEQLMSYLPRLAELGVELIEQPLSRTSNADMANLKPNAPIPLFADESCQGEGDVANCAAGFHGINIKLTKCGGITPALRMIQQARELGLQVMLGCMNEGIIGTAALVHLSPLADKLDADGPLLLQLPPTTGFTIEGGNITLPQTPGLGMGYTERIF